MNYTRIFTLIALAVLPHSSFSNDITDIVVTSQAPQFTCSMQPEYVETMLKDFNIVQYDQKVNGHTSKKHLSQDKQALLERLEKNIKLVAASSYTSQAIAEHVITTGLNLDKVKIAQWINAGSATNNILKLEYNTSKPIGQVVLREKYEQISSSIAVVVLRKEKNCGFKIVTSYPKAIANTKAN